MFKQYINGELVEGLGAKNSVQDPATGETIATIACATAAQATEALNAAQAAFTAGPKRLSHSASNGC